jgi:ubiquinone/menaquinone biosynthesis C-methylase UbiE
MLTRVLEPEAMDTAEEAHDYDAMDHSGVNERFVTDFLAAHGPCRSGEILDVGTGPARIPIALASADPNARVVGIDLTQHMLIRARENVASAGLTERIRLEPADAKGLSYSSGTFEAVLSNTIAHHIPDPAPALGEMARVVAPGGTLLIRDLARPESLDEVAHLVQTYAGNEAPAARALFEASLHAALTLAEVRDMVQALGLPSSGVTMTSDRHWTWCWRRPS